MTIEELEKFVLLNEMTIIKYINDVLGYKHIESITSTELNYNSMILKCRIMNKNSYKNIEIRDDFWLFYINMSYDMEFRLSRLLKRLYKIHLIIN